MARKRRGMVCGLGDTRKSHKVAAKAWSSWFARDVRSTKESIAKHHCDLALMQLVRAAQSGGIYTCHGKGAKGYKSEKQKNRSVAVDHATAKLTALFDRKCMGR